MNAASGIWSWPDVFATVLRRNIKGEGGGATVWVGLAGRGHRANGRWFGVPLICSTSAPWALKQANQPGVCVLYGINPLTLKECVVLCPLAECYMRVCHSAYLVLSVVLGRSCTKSSRWLQHSTCDLGSSKLTSQRHPLCAATEHTCSMWH